MSLRDKILAVKDCKLEKYHVEDWDLTVWLKTWSGVDRARVIAIYKSDLATTKIVQLSVCDEDGAAVFSEKDIAELSSKNGEVLDKIAFEACKVNGLYKEAVEDAKNESEAETQS